MNTKPLQSAKQTPLSKQDKRLQNTIPGRDKGSSDSSNRTVGEIKREKGIKDTDEQKGLIQGSDLNSENDI